MVSPANLLAGIPIYLLSIEKMNEDTHNNSDTHISINSMA